MTEFYLTEEHYNILLDKLAKIEIVLDNHGKKLYWINKLLEGKQ